MAVERRFSTPYDTMTRRRSQLSQPVFPLPAAPRLKAVLAVRMARPASDDVAAQVDDFEIREVQ